MRLLMFFIDGVGIGRRDAAVNPFFVARLPTLTRLFSGRLPSLSVRRLSSSLATLLPFDATLGVEGLPQSGTGQTALFTGVNAARLIGKHFGPYPFSTLRPVIAAQSIFRLLRDRGVDPCFANSYPSRYFEYMERHPSRRGVVSSAALSAGLSLRTIDELSHGTGISADITGAGWHALGYPDLPILAPQEAGRRCARLLRRHPFVVFEYSKTDHAGHSMQMEEAVSSLEAIDGFIGGILDVLDGRRDLLFITSDHGNVEDLSTKSHTRNPVPGVFIGHRHAEVADLFARLRDRGPSIRDVTPLFLSLITSTE